MTTSNTFPKQRISEREKLAKDCEWGKETIDQLIMNSVPFHGGHYAGRMNNGMDNDYSRMVSNYMLYNNVINQEDFERECNPLGLNVGEFKDEIKPYNKTYNKIQVLLGEELKRPFDYTVAVTDTDSIRTKMMEHDQKIQEAISNTMSKIQQIIQSNMDMQNPQELSPEQQQQMEQEMDAEFAKFFSKEQLGALNDQNFINKKEAAARKLLRYFALFLNLPSLKNDGFKHSLIAGTEITWVGTSRGMPVVRNVNPLSFSGWKQMEEKYYQNGLYGLMSTLMKKEDIIPAFADFLSEEQLEEVEQGIWGVSGSGTSNKMMRYDYNSPVDTAYRRWHRGTPYYGQYGNDNDTVLSDEWEVHHVEWRSLRKVYFATSINEWGDESLEILSEDFEIPSYAIKERITNKYGKKKTIYRFDDVRLEEHWIDDVWEGYKLGDMYAGVRRKDFQFRTLANPFDVKLGYHGVSYSNTNAPNTSVMDRMKPFQYLYLIVAHKLKTFIAADRAPVHHFDLSMVDPKLGLEKTLYYLDQMNIDFYNPLQNAEEAGAYQRGKITGSTDRSTMQHINNYISVMAHLDHEISDAAGVSKQREGSTSEYETATANQQSIVQSSHVTEVYFDTHNKHWENVLNSFLQVAQDTYKENGFLVQYILDDLSVETLDITPDLMQNSDFGVFVSNSRKDNEIFQQLTRLSEFALNSQQAKLSDIVRLYKATSSAEMEQILKTSEKNLEEQMQQQQQAAAEAEQAKAQADMQVKAQEHEYNKEIEQMKIDADIRMKEMDVFKFQQDLDINDNRVPDHLEVEKLRVETQLKTRELDLREKEIDTKKEIEKAKAAKSSASKSS